MGEILFLAHRMPWPPDRGDKIRSHWILKKLASIAPVHVGCFADDARDAGFADALSGLAATCHVARRTRPMWRAGLMALATGRPVSLTAFHDAGLAQWVRATLARRPIDRIFVFSGQMASYVPAEFTGRLIMDFVDVDSAKFDAYGRAGHSPVAWLHAREGWLLSAFEQDVARRADASLFVSTAEAGLFCERGGPDDGRVMALGNGIDAHHYDPHAPGIAAPAGASLPDAPLIVFTGQMDYRPNVEAVCDFARHVLPAVRAVHRDARFAIVGRHPAAAVRALAALDGVVVTGAVDDVRGWLKAADVVVAPLRIARGIQNKVLEAMAMARPVVASTAAAEGIEAVQGAHWMVAASHAEEAAMVIDLLADPDRAAAIGAAARGHVEAHYGWDAQLALLDQLMGIDGAGLGHPAMGAAA